MTTYTTALPCTGTSMTCDLRAIVSAVARGDNSGWDVSFSLALVATNNSGFPNSAGSNTGHLYVGGGLRVNFSGPFDFPSGHGAGYTITLGSSSYFLPVTPDGTGTLAVSYDFTEAGSPTIGNGSGAGSYTLPPIPRGGKIRVAGVWKPRIRKIKVAGVWKPVTRKIKISGTWEPII